MRIAWFTPLDGKSAIADCSRLIVAELARHCEVDVWTHDHALPLEPETRVVRFDPSSAALRQLGNYDHCIYNMGNFHQFHAAIYEAMKAHPGVVVLHDFVMHHFFMVEYLHERRAPELYVAEMERSYGSAGRDAAHRSLSSSGTGIWLTDEVTRFPLYERLVDCATGVFVHSAFHSERVRKSYLGDVGFAYLPYRPSPVTRRREDLFREFGVPVDRVVAISTGIVHPVKRIEQVLSAIAGNPRLSERLVYVIVGDGPREYRAKLESMAAEAGIAASIRFFGYQPADVLRDLLSAADFAINLRFPNSEGCSLSLIEQMAHGNPVVAINSGMYREMPDAAVLKIPASDRGQELARAIEKLTFSDEARLRMGIAAESFAHENFTAEAYAVRFLGFLKSQRELSYRPIHASLHEVSAALSAGGFPIEHGTHAVESVLRAFRAIVNGPESAMAAETGATLRTLGIWLGFEHETPLHREGMTRFLRYLAQYLIERHDVDCEIWCYSFNEASVRESFRSLLSERRMATRIRIVHEKNCVSAFGTPSSYDRIPDVSVAKNNLCELANEFSRADCFLLGICYLDNALALTKPLFIPLHDLVVLENYRAFVGDNEDFRPYARKIREAVEQFNRRDAFFFCNSDYVRRRQLMKYVRHVDEKRTAVVYLPVNIPIEIQRRLPAEEDVRARFGISAPYFFYPTQIRHHKNVLTLLQAFKELVDQGLNVQLVLTGSPEHVPAVAQYISENQLDQRVVLAKDISEETLYAMHAYATATTVPTLFEGGFPWQALEAMLMNTPAILSNIEAVSERLAAFGIDSSGLRLFEPMDVVTLTRHMQEALSDRAGLVRQQSAVVESIFRHQWKDVASAYFRVMTDRLQSLALDASPGESHSQA
jgi:glycosyltransferase involved in cell wall biosynthesis